MTLAVQNPFPGLRQFEIEDAPFFFGRDEVIDEILDRLDSDRAAALIGSSGCGKSSLVRAGVLPAIMEGPTQCKIAVLRPGSDPMGNLAAALEKAGISAPEGTLRASSFGIVECVNAAGASGKRLVIVVDQFEEIFWLRSYFDRAEDADFFAALLASAITSDASIYVLISLRADFTAELTQLPALPEALSRGLVLIPRMSRGQLTEAIERPVEEMHAAIERSCVQKILNDLNDVPDALSRLQHVLMRMWESWQDCGIERPIDLADYYRVGTIANALDQHADSLLRELSETDHSIAECMFRSLSTEQAGLIYRRPARVQEVADVAASTSDSVLRVAQPFISAGFLSPAGPASSETVLDLVHESLLRGWRTLAEWVAKETEARNSYLRLVEQAKYYGRDQAYLLHGIELGRAMDWMNKWRPNQAWAARYSELGSLQAVVDYIKRSFWFHGEQMLRSHSERAMLRRRQAFRLLCLLLTVIITLLYTLPAL